MTQKAQKNFVDLFKKTANKIKKKKTEISSIGEEYKERIKRAGINL